jgi:hypothetical protein
VQRIAYYQQQAMLDASPLAEQVKTPPIPAYEKILCAHAELDHAVDQLAAFVEKFFTRTDVDPRDDELTGHDCGSTLHAFLDNFPERIEKTTGKVLWIHSVLEAMLFPVEE